MGASRAAAQVPPRALAVLGIAALLAVRAGACTVSAPFGTWHVRPAEAVVPRHIRKCEIVRGESLHARQAGRPAAWASGSILSPCVPALFMTEDDPRADAMRQAKRWCERLRCASLGPPGDG